MSQLEADSSAVDGLRDGIKGIDGAIDKVGSTAGGGWIDWQAEGEQKQGMGRGNPKLLLGGEVQLQCLKALW